VPASPRDPELEAAIRRRASELWERRGRIDGHGVEDWVQAEKEVLAERQKKAARRVAALVVKVKDVTYTAEYDPENAAGYKPGEFSAGDTMQLRFDGERMFVRRRDGSEFQTRIVKKQKHHSQHG
jgi:Protein of unknown function (DUF2934)